jgi:hypothetical protein
MNDKVFNVEFLYKYRELSPKNKKRAMRILKMNFNKNWEDSECIDFINLNNVLFTKDGFPE